MNLTETPGCDDGPTPSQTEGPYFTPHSPERASLREEGMKGTAIILTGKVLNTNCQPVKNALLDWWHADSDGNYDNEGFRFRGHQYTDGNGMFRLETIVPGVYPGRTRHFHVKVQAPGKNILSTQLYFPGEAGNDGDSLYNPLLLMNIAGSSAPVRASYTFVVKA